MERCKGNQFSEEFPVPNWPLCDTLGRTNEEPPKLRIEGVALYARVSTKDGRQDTENQLLALREYCAKQAWEIADEYIDHESGGHSRRPNFRRESRPR